MEKAILMGPFIGELYWECGRFAPMLPKFKLETYKDKDIKYIIMTRPDRFDLYGKSADILVPLRINGDYENKQPNCFSLNGFSGKEYHRIVKSFFAKYSERFKIVKHIYPDISKGKYVNKNQFPRKDMLFRYFPRNENYKIIDDFLGQNKKPIVILAPRFRKGFRRNWKNWPEFYNLICNDKKLLNNFNFIICGKEDEYIPDEKNRFLDMAKINIGDTSSRIGLLLVLMEKASLVCGSQSAIPNIGLLYKVEVLEFGCQKTLHTVTYNVNHSPITFIENKGYDLQSNVLFNEMKKLLRKYEGKENAK